MNDKIGFSALLLFLAYTLTNWLESERFVCSVHNPMEIHCHRHECPQGVLLVWKCADSSRFTLLPSEKDSTGPYFTLSPPENDSTSPCGYFLVSVTSECTPCCCPVTLFFFCCPVTLHLPAVMQPFYSWAPLANTSDFTSFSCPAIPSAD